MGSFYERPPVHQSHFLVLESSLDQARGGRWKEGGLRSERFGAGRVEGLRVQGFEAENNKGNKKKLLSLTLI